MVVSACIDKGVSLFRYCEANHLQRRGCEDFFQLFHVGLCGYCMDYAGYYLFVHATVCFQGDDYAQVVVGRVGLVYDFFIKGFTYYDALVRKARIK